MKRFSFESDMNKGQCSCCPLLDWSEERTEFICSMTGECIPLEVDPQDCPLEEYHGVEWHKYPEEKPPETGYYLITVDLGRGIYVRSDHYTDGSVMLGGRWDEGFVVCGTKPIAWAYMPKPYKGEE